MCDDDFNVAIMKEIIEVSPELAERVRIACKQHGENAAQFLSEWDNRAVDYAILKVTARVAGSALGPLEFTLMDYLEKLLKQRVEQGPDGH